MTTKENLKYSVIFRELKKNKKAQEAALGLARNDNWGVLKQFVTQVKSVLLESIFDIDNLDEIRKYKYLIRGMERVVLLPRLVDFVKDSEKEDEISKKEKEADAKRRKYNPGAFIRKVVEKVKKK